MVILHGSLGLSLSEIREQVKQYEQRYGRQVHAVGIIAVSKRVVESDIRQVYRQDQRDFAENLLQEALPKITALKDCSIVWHFIGNIQSNKCRQIAEYFSWVHSVDRHKIIERLAEFRPKTLPPLNICVQVNIDEEASKQGIRLEELPSFVENIGDYPQLKLRGLMAVPKPRRNFDEQCKGFAKLKSAFVSLNDLGFACDTLSMGMSNDFQAAIASGATMIRVGTALFGARE